MFQFTSACHRRVRFACRRCFAQASGLPDVKVFHRKGKVPLAPLDNSEKVVYIGMFGDPLHAGHVAFIRFAARYGKVTVGLQTDESLDMPGVFDQDTQPFFRYSQRKDVIRNMKGVADVIPQSFRTKGFISNLRAVRPDYLVHSDSWGDDALQESIRAQIIDALQEWGGQLVEPRISPEINTFDILTRATMAQKIKCSSQRSISDSDEPSNDSRASNSGILPLVIANALDQAHEAWVYQPLRGLCVRAAKTLPAAVTPNAVTTLSGAMLIPAIWCTAHGAPMLAASAIVAQDLLDRLDGAIASLRKEHGLPHDSHFGGFYDAMVDRVFGVGVLTGLCVLVPDVPPAFAALAAVKIGLHLWLMRLRVDDYRTPPPGVVNATHAIGAGKMASWLDNSAKLFAVLGVAAGVQSTLGDALFGGSCLCLCLSVDMAMRSIASKIEQRVVPSSGHSSQTNDYFEAFSVPLDHQVPVKSISRDDAVRVKSRTIVTFGTFDLFHRGHLRILERAAQLGDRLVVGVSSDEMNWDKKNLLPTIPLSHRFALVNSMKQVDATFVEESLEAKREYLLQNNADVLVMGDDHTGAFDHLSDIVEVVYLPRTEGVSTTLVRTNTVG